VQGTDRQTDAQTVALPLSAVDAASSSWPNNNYHSIPLRTISSGPSSLLTYYVLSLACIFCYTVKYCRYALGRYGPLMRILSGYSVGLPVRSRVMRHFPLCAENPAVRGIFTLCGFPAFIERLVAKRINSTSDSVLLR